MSLDRSDLVQAEVAFDATDAPDVLILACGAIAREVLAVIRLNGWTHVDVRCLPAKLHSTPQKIAGAVDAKLTELAGRYDRVFVAYADCGTAGALDKVLTRHDVERLPGAHCYGFLAGNDAWDAMQEDEPATFYLTDFLARHFESLVVRGLKLDAHPELVPMMFGNYKRLVYLAQTDDDALRARAEAAGSVPRARFRAAPDRVRRAATVARPVRHLGCRVPELTVISWRAIPAQVTAGKGRGASRIQLSERFQEAIDAAAMRAGLIGTDSYLEEWRRESRQCGDDLAAEVAAVAAQLEDDYPDDRLERLVRASGEEESA